MRWILLMAVVACALPVRAESPSPPPADAHGLTVTLVWDAPVDLDLYVTDPAWVTVYYARRAGHLSDDARCTVDGVSARWERARWTDPPRGRYRVGVDFPDACRSDAEEVDYRVIVDREGTRQETSGRVRLAERQPAALEFTVP